MIFASLLTVSEILRRTVVLLPFERLWVRELSHDKIEVILW